MVDLEHAIYVDQPDSQSINLRAVAPEPTVVVMAVKSGPYVLEVSNLSPSLILNAEGDGLLSVQEKIQGTHRTIQLALETDQSIKLNWKLAEQDGAKFAVIGDTGAGKELEWVLRRASELDAQFLLHLGDFNYSKGEYDRAVELFNSAAMPCYVSIGNHDYNDSGLIYQQFINEIGPMNLSFTVAGTRFANIDTAADFFPASSGQRRKLFDDLLADQSDFDDQVFFTHRPFYDVRPGEDHIIGGIGQIEWLQKSIRNCGCRELMTGHVHHSAETDLQGLRQWTVGEGLGFEDILNQKQVARMLLGTVERGRKVSYQWAAINMPWWAHLSPTHETKLKRYHTLDKLEWYRSNVINAG
jgi:predicted phosphodiesterase